MIPDIRFEKNNPNCLVFHYDLADSIIFDDIKVNDRYRGRDANLLFKRAL